MHSDWNNIACPSADKSDVKVDENMGSRIIGCRIQLHTSQAQRPQTGLAIDLHVLPCEVLQLLIDGIAGVQPLIYDRISSLH